MDKGFSSKVTEELYNYVIAQDLRGEQICELANRLHEYGRDKQLEQKRKDMLLHVFSFFLFNAAFWSNKRLLLTFWVKISKIVSSEKKGRAAPCIKTVRITRSMCRS